MLVFSISGFPLLNSDNTINMFKVLTENQNSSIITRLLHHAAFIVKRNTPINYPDVSDKVLSSERVKSAIKTSVMEDLKGQNVDDSIIMASQIMHKQRASNILHQMKSCISAFLLKLAAWVMYKLLGKMLDGIDIHRDQMDNIKKASEKNIPIIYLPLHRSHLDYILVTFILYMNDLRAPLVAAGNNLMIPFFGALLRGLGAFFIKRKLDPQNGQRDFVYRAILHTYMEQSLKKGHSLEFFIEGGRSRTGKAVLPKAGLLSIVVDSLLSGSIRDAFIVPIAISYEKLLDGNFISEQLGKPKEMENFTSAIQAIWRTLHSNFGMVRVDFCQPFSLKEFLFAAEYSYNSAPRMMKPCLFETQFPFNQCTKIRRRSEYGTEVVSEDHRQLIKDLADYVVYDSFNAYALMSTNILAFLFLTKHRKGTTCEQLVNSVNWLREEIAKRNKTIGFSGDSEDLIKRATNLLGKNLINVETVHLEWSSFHVDNNMKLIFYKPAINAPKVLELHYYANAVLPVFLLESIIINAVWSIISENIENIYSNKTVLLRSQILKYSMELCSLLQYEFIFSPPGTSVYSVLNVTIDELIERSLFIILQNDENEELKDSLYDDKFQYEMTQSLQLNLNGDNKSMCQFLKCVIASFIESYFMVASTLPKLINLELEETLFLQEIKRLIEKQIHVGNIYYEECLGLDALKNALKLFETWKIINVKLQNSQKFYSLHSPYNTDNLKDIIKRIEKYIKPFI